MPFKVLFVTATEMEAGALKKIKSLISVPGGYSIDNVDINLLITGVGSTLTSWTLKQWITDNGKPDLAINGGIAGSYKADFKIGDVVMPISDCFADAGIEDGEEFQSLFEAGLTDYDEFPFNHGLLIPDTGFIDKVKNILRPVRAITVNTATGSESSRLKLLKRFNPDIETMEGATFFYICARENIPFLALRAISNRVERRNKNNWNIPLALDNLSEKLNEVIIRLE
jgi:futalosine hydrolase